MARRDPDAMSVGQHLVELRRRLIISIGALALFTFVSAFFYGWMLHFLQRPYCDAFPHHCSFYVTNPLDPLSLRVKLAFFGGLVLSTPIFLFQMWRFINPGLRSKERRYAIPFIIAAVVFFLLGCLTAYIIFPHAMKWLFSIGGSQLHDIVSPTAYLKLIVLLMILFGLTYEFPVILVALELMGVVSSKSLLAHWRWAIIAIVVVAGVFTPSSDPFSMLALTIPLVIFYFGAIGVGKLFHR
jgi:sec-independent protein translocase protein TatC